MDAKRPTNTPPPHIPEKWDVTSRAECVRWGLTGSRSLLIYVGLFACIQVSFMGVISRADVLWCAGWGLSVSPSLFIHIGLFSYMQVSLHIHKSLCIYEKKGVQSRAEFVGWGFSVGRVLFMHIYFFLNTYVFSHTCLKIQYAI